MISSSKDQKNDSFTIFNYIYKFNIVIKNNKNLKTIIL